MRTFPLTLAALFVMAGTAFAQSTPSNSTEDASSSAKTASPSNSSTSSSTGTANPSATDANQSSSIVQVPREVILPSASPLTGAYGRRQEKIHERLQASEQHIARELNVYRAASPMVGAGLSSLCLVRRGHPITRALCDDAAGSAPGIQYEKGASLSCCDTRFDKPITLIPYLSFTDPR